MDIGREEARELARDELRDPAYDRDESLTEQVVRWILDRLGDLLDGMNTAVNAPPGIAAIVAAALIAVLVVILRSGPLGLRTARRRREVFDAERLTAQVYRERAESAAADEDWARAIVERFRAVVAVAEERGIIDERPGRTADEAARDIGHEVRHLTGRLANAAAAFDAIRYGSQHGDRSTYSAMRELDDAMQRAGHDAEPAPDDAPTPPAVPR